MDVRLADGRSAESVATEFREVMAGVCTPVAVVTAMDGTRPHGTTVSAFASLSMRPPMVLISLDRGSALLTVVRQTGRFGVNIMSHTQSGTAMQFARKGPDKFEGTSWTSSSGLPRLHGTSGWLACDLVELVDGGDHVIAYGGIVEAVKSSVAPLTYHARTFGTHSAVEVKP
ncbi:MULTISPECIES: flavin reductase family protein [Rhodococcus]|uniref:Flavin reductase family protein n=1 Tax=Rhodococcus oxybenzonivorans TaxID=1990687 RepID=A0AAE4V317_9NOCA|nr:MULTISPECIES: flavin reductase family protein [Rhodococcus]MDV7241126.1 flavin reductase family protein [Rhodococcus oxybenzonivorans]MDV7266894.1 flavin reductase family protein [Rhodococcus oxybenzonivorans]MDV7273399.1 flavin reductase family protein [Rhodococcus oxybenzonivorans]MDV7332863.1 flavin reductase family protein [Rhodococcus oxybenzonivorans]MDV7342029.1 flavin reductase family protein [Rhodococcus oxybenzonivorans]